MHAPGGIRPHNPSKRAAADPRLRRRGHWDRHELCLTVSYQLDGQHASFSYTASTERPLCRERIDCEAGTECRAWADRFKDAGHKAPYTLSVKLIDFTLWRHTWRKNWINCAVFTGNSLSLRTVLFSRLSHRELRSSLRESQSFPCLPADTTKLHAQKDIQNWQKKLTNLMGNLGCAREHSVQFFVQFFTQLNSTVYLECMLSEPQKRCQENISKRDKIFTKI
jgi:hypothetical protein